jgi:hypothetical protein
VYYRVPKSYRKNLVLDERLGLEHSISQTPGRTLTYVKQLEMLAYAWEKRAES